MKKFGLILILILSVMVFGTTGACVSNTHVNDASSSITLSSQGATDFTLTVKPSQNGTVTIKDNITHAIFGSKIDILVNPADNYEVVWVKINHGNRAEDKIVYFSEDIHSGVISDIRVEYNMEIEAYFAPVGSIQKVSHSYVGQPVSSSVQNAFNVISVACVNGSVSASAYENITVGDRVKVTATPNSGYSLVEIIVRDTEDYNIIEVDADGYFTMPACNVAIMASFI